jgi:glycosyltransferase involved in cell wall biosynthesis
VKLVSVITPSYKRTDLLLRAVNSVKNQDYPNIEHIIVGDNHPTLSTLREQIMDSNPMARVENLDTPEEIIYPAHRTSIARNHGISIAKGYYIAHLDDDNQIEPNHISSLVATLERDGADASHCWRKLFTAGGNPFIVKTYPWVINPDLAEYIFGEFIKAGICIPMTNEFRDQMVTPQGDPILHVDSSEWLIKREVHQRIKFPVRYCLRQMIQHQTEDFLLATAFYQNGIKVVCSEKASLLYYLGGYSNGSHG